MSRVFARLMSVIIACLLITGAASAEPGKYQGPTDVVASPDGKTLYVVCSDANKTAVVDSAGWKIVRTIGCPATPTGLTLCPAGKVLFVTCAAPEGSVLFIDAASGKAYTSAWPLRAWWTLDGRVSSLSAAR